MRISTRSAASAALAIAATLSLSACASGEDPAPAHSYAPGVNDFTTGPAAPGPTAADAARPAAATSAPTGPTGPTGPTAPGADVPVTAAGGPAPRPTITVTAAPKATTDDGTRVLRIPAQGVSAAVFNCSTDSEGVVTPPPMVKDVCWWTGSRPLDAAQGVSIVVGHSTRSADSTGALERTRYLPIGAVVTLAGQTWKVAAIETDVDKRGLPAWITYATGPRMLGLITCDLTNRKSNVLVRLLPA